MLVVGVGGWVGGMPATTWTVSNSYTLLICRVGTLAILVKMFGCCFRDERSVKTFQLIDRLQIYREQTR